MFSTGSHVGAQTQLPQRWTSVQTRIYPARQACALRSRHLPPRSLCQGSTWGSGEHSRSGRDGQAPGWQRRWQRDGCGARGTTSSSRALPSTAIVCRGTAGIPSARHCPCTPKEQGHGSMAGTVGTSRRRLCKAPARESSCTLPLRRSFCVPEISSPPGHLHV